MGTTSRVRVWSVLAEISGKLDRPFNLDHLARLAGLSSRQFSRVFRAQFGHSPAAALRLLRMRVAHRLLTTTSLSVKEVAARSGFRDLSHFVKGFAKLYGRPPGRCRGAVFAGKATVSDD